MMNNPAFFNQRDKEGLPGRLGLRSTQISSFKSCAELTVTPQLLAINGFLHAGSVVTLADTTAGYGCMANLPTGASGFTTLELKCNFMGTAREGRIVCTAQCIHHGKTTQVWDSRVVDSTNGKTIAEFRCTQLILYPKSD